MIRRGEFVAVVFVTSLALLVGLPGEAGAANRAVNCPGGTIQAAVDSACSGDTISVSGKCNESVTINTQSAGCGGGAFRKLSLKGNSGTVNHFTGSGPAFLITGNARNINMGGFTVGADDGHGIEVAGAHRVTLSGIRTTSTDHASKDGIHIDTASTRVQVRSSTLLDNGEDGVEMGATYGEVTSVTANDNGAAGINVTGSNVNVTRCKAIETNAVGNVQQEGFRFSGPGAIVQQCSATGNAVAQFHDTSTSTGVIHFRNTAGSSRTASPTFPSDDVQALDEGKGAANSDCVTAGGNSILDTTPTGDDTISGDKITSGLNGICQSTAEVDDVQALPVGQGTPNTDCVTPGPNTTLETSPSGDDAIAVNKITSGANGICESSVGAAGFLEEGSGNRIHTCTATRNSGDGFRFDGPGDALQASVSNLNVGSQLEVGGNNNFIQSNTFTRVSTGPFISRTSAVNCPVGQSNFFDRNRVSISTPKDVGNGYNVLETSNNNGSRNARAPGDANDPPANLR